ncbi:MAG: hypothetical protein JXL80_07240, partial [Planctomycetes bacterium]|nr:hypothetical protein [Planctomycetota bacterium]
MTESRVWEVDNAIRLYRETFGDYPPSGKPAGVDWSSYPDGVFEMKDHLKTYSDYQYFDLNYEGGTNQAGKAAGVAYLVYFLFGPNRTGWSPSTHAVMTAWAAPVGLDKYLSKDVCPSDIESTGYGYNFGTRPFFVFEDAFGLSGRGPAPYSGAILYLRANPRVRHRADDEKNEVTVCPHDRSPNYRWYQDDTAGQYSWDCNGEWGSGPQTGDHKPTENLARMLRQNPKEFALISAGADTYFGYRAIGTHSRNQERAGADWDDGSTDDITNFDHD